jgi:sugar phosphate isomerase/epimerase
MTTRLVLFRSLWTNGFNLDGAIADCRTDVFDGVEGPVREGYAERLIDAGVPFIAEISTGGGYVPETRDMGKHLDDFARKVAAALDASPLFVTALAGCDSWPVALSVEFLGRAVEFVEQTGVPASFETHRSRSTFTPWVTAELLRQLPALHLTCDFSHWCCICERLVLDEESDLLALFVSRARHIHARVGYDQGPQVPHPAAPEYQDALDAHERWWGEIWRARSNAGCEFVTMTPEFGPDGYLHTLPFTKTPVASLDKINGWMAVRLRERFANLSLLEAVA